MTANIQRFRVVTLCTRAYPYHSRNVASFYTRNAVATATAVVKTLAAVILEALLEPDAEPVAPAMTEPAVLDAPRITSSAS